MGNVRWKRGNRESGDVMDDNIKESGEQSPAVVERIGRRKIRSKLLAGFLVLIGLTLIVVAITVVSQTWTQEAMDDMVNVQGVVARLSLETDKYRLQMASYEKDFLLNHNRIGIRKAKEIYLNPFVEYGGKAYRTLYQIQQLATAQQDIDAAQTAMDAINEYLSAFVGTVNILEQRVDPEFGELVKLNGSIAKLGETVLDLDIQDIEEPFYGLKDAYHSYLMFQTPETTAEVSEERLAMQRVVAGIDMDEKARKKVVDELAEFQKWFDEVSTTDGVISARISGYQDAAKRAEPVIKSFLDFAVANEAEAINRMEESNQQVRNIVFGVGVVSVLLGLFIAVRLSRGLTNQVNHIMELLDEIGAGNFSARTEVVSNDELGVMANALNGLLDNITVLIQSQEERDAIQESIMTLLEEISALTDGDFTVRAEVTEDMTGAIADSFNAMADQFAELIGKVKKATAAVDKTSEDVAQKTMGLAEKNIEQVKGVGEAVKTIEQMVGSIRAVADNARRSSDVSRQSRENAREGAEAVDRTNQAMSEIREQINETARSIKRLGESSLEITNIVKIIEDIADRTSILALNASIQAASAGDAGHGFAVVADEVQRLADSSSNSTKQIEVLIKGIQNEIQDLTHRIDESISKVVDGSKLADGAHAKLQEIEQVSRDLADLVESISNSAGDQVLLSETISNVMEEVGEISRQSSLSTQDTAASMNILSKTARDLRASVEVFKIGDEEEAEV